MLDFFFAYLIAVALISGMVILALRNQKQGWRRQRAVWRQVQSTAGAAAAIALEARVDPPLQHLDDLLRLQQSLAHQNEPAQKEHLTSKR